MADYQAISERGRVLQREYLDRMARERQARIPASVPKFGPDWRDKAAEMIERVRSLRGMLRVAAMSETPDEDS